MVVYNMNKRHAIKQRLTPGTFNGGMSCVLAWQQILKHSLAFMGNKHNHLTWQ
jgi:hypothetical protein